jgi:5-methyltetrahydrofolate--homocysteine methyltransferase
MKDFLSYLDEKVVIWDGAMGTSIQNKGTSSIDFQGSECVEYINVLQPNFIAEIHADFLVAGAEVIETNTFGALPYLLSEYNLSKSAREINIAGVRLALDVARSFSGNRYVAGSIGPGTKLPSLGQIGYRQLYEDYLLQAECLIETGVHIIQIETGQDPLQMKIALRAVLDSKKKFKKDIPIFMQATLGENGQMLVGTDLRTFINTFCSMPIHGIGLNCGTGPHFMADYVRILSENCPKYLAILPNAGLPILVDGQMTYDLSANQFGKICADLVRNYRLNAIGGCCGTTHEFIAELSQQVGQVAPKKGKIPVPPASLTSIYNSQEIRTFPPPLIIGERANVNGSKKFKNLLQAEKWDEMVEICLTQQEEGAHGLDICLNHLGRNETADMQKFVTMLNKSVSIPLVIDSTSFTTVEAALQLTTGRAMVNSVNFENGDANVIRYIELCRDLNAALICLLIDERGMASKFEHKVEIINRLCKLCSEHNFPKQHIFIDCLTFALTTGDGIYRDAGISTIQAIKYIKDNHPEIHTILGISNVSFGMKPEIRKMLNSLFLHECVKNGLTAAIVDPAKILPVNEITIEVQKLCIGLVYNDTSEGDPLMKLAGLTTESGDIIVKQVQNNNENFDDENINHAKQLYQSVIKGRTGTIVTNIGEMIKNTEPSSILNDILLPAMSEVGVLFEKGKMQLPFVLKSAEIMRIAVDILKPHMTVNSNEKVNKSMLIATVFGDVHDIGKNLVKIIVENNGYTVIDIGEKQSSFEIYEAIIKHQPTCLGLSALLIKSTHYMKDTLVFLHSKGISIPVICGGAALNREYVEQELQPIYGGKVSYGKDAFAGLRFIERL